MRRTLLKAAQRWLILGHRWLDLPLLILRRPAWDAAQRLLNGSTGIVVGWRRIPRPKAARA